MIQINLLPIREIKRRNKAKKELFLALLGFCLFLAVLALIAIAQAIQIKGLRADLEDRRREKAKYDQQLKEIDALEAEKRLLQTRIQVIEKLKAVSGVAVHVMDDVANRTPPDRMWITKMSQRGNSSLQLTGMSQDNQTVARYMQDLESSAYLGNVVLVKSDTKKYAGRDLKEFTLRTSIKVPEVKKKSVVQSASPAQ